MPDSITIKTILYLRTKFERDGWVEKNDASWEKYLRSRWDDCYYAVWKSETLGEPLNY